MLVSTVEACCGLEFFVSESSTPILRFVFVANPVRFVLCTPSSKESCPRLQDQSKTDIGNVAVDSNQKFGNDENFC